jgi:threonine dehydrogenase-like Zn-dependent dehydrogenase
LPYVCRPAGVLSVPGVYGGLLDKIPFGIVMNKGLTIRTGQTHVNRWIDDLLRRIEEGQIPPSSSRGTCASAKIFPRMMA